MDTLAEIKERMAAGRNIGQCRRDWMIREIDRLRVIEAEVPKTADGVTVVLNDTVYVVRNNGVFVALVDVYDALSSPRIYKAAIPHDECVDAIRKESGTMFDPKIVEIWLKIEPEFRAIAKRYLGDTDLAGSLPSVGDPPAPEVLQEDTTCVV